MKILILIALTTLALGCQLDEDESVATAAIDDDPNDEPPVNRCLEDTTGTLTASASMVTWPQTVSLAWNATVPTGCTVRIFLNATQVARQGTLVVQPQADSTHRLRVSVVGVGERVLASRFIKVETPQVVQITSNDQVPLFVQTVQTADRTVTIANHVQLDLSNRADISLARNVTIRGGRGGLQPGARLFTTTRPGMLFAITKFASNVRITGVRIEGPDMNADGEYSTIAIAIDSATNVDIDHNEISGWGGAAIDVKDNEGTMASPSPAATSLGDPSVQIYDNYIHHNQAGDGYGVVSGYGAHPYIARNTFNWNRHAVAGDGRPGTGYTAYHNLVLEDGGLHQWVPILGFWIHTHQFDMHGRGHCGVASTVNQSLYNCGPAGHTMLIRHNAFFYAHDNAIKLRGTPAVGMYVGNNVFANHTMFLGSAADQEETGLVQEPGNLFAYNGKVYLATCDLDGDGNADQFLATGKNWWYRSGGTAPWTFLNASTRRATELTFGFFDGDNHCDVRSSPDNIVFPGGKPPPSLPGGDGSWSW